MNMAYAVEDIELYRALVTISATDDLSIGGLDGLEMICGQIGPTISH